MFLLISRAMSAQPNSIQLLFHAAHIFPYSVLILCNSDENRTAVSSSRKVILLLAYTKTVNINI